MRFLPPSARPDVVRVRHAWNAFVANGTLDSSALRPHIVRAWTRSRASGCDPRQARADVLPAADTAALLEQERRLVDVATPFLLALSRAAGQDRHAAMLADGRGRVLRIVGDAETMADADFPGPGSLLSEATAGANGIGTTLAEGHYVELVGPEHYIEGFHVFTCQGVPLLTQGDTASGVLSMSVRRVEAAARVRDILFCASEAAECELIAASLAEILDRRAAAAAILEALRQDILQRIAHARLELEVAARRMAAGADALAVLRNAHGLVARFRRQAAIWRDLVGEGQAGTAPIVLPDLVEEFCDLLRTEARVAFVALHLRRVDKVVVLDDARALSRRLLTAFLDAIQASDRHADLHVDVERDGLGATVRIGTTTPSGPSFFEVSVPALP